MKKRIWLSNQLEHQIPFLQTFKTYRLFVGEPSSEAAREKGLVGMYYEKDDETGEVTLPENQHGGGKENLPHLQT